MNFSVVQNRGYLIPLICNILDNPGPESPEMPVFDKSHLPGGEIQTETFHNTCGVVKKADIYHIYLTFVFLRCKFIRHKTKP